MVGFVICVVCEFPVEPPRNKDVAAKYFLTFYPGADEAAAIFGTSVGGRIAERKATRPSGDDGSRSKLWVVLSVMSMCRKKKTW